MRKNSPLLFLAFALLLPMLLLVQEVGSAAEDFFEDVPVNHWAYNYIKDLFDDGYISGCSLEPLLYCTGQSMSRAEASVFVDRGLESADFHPSDPTVPPFVDVPLTHWAAEWIDNLKEIEFTSGCGVNDADQALFCPEAFHTRAEAAVFFYRMLKAADAVPPAPNPDREFKYGDVPTDDSEWYNDWVYAAYDEGIVGDCEDPPNVQDNLFRPNDQILREEAACMMHHAIYSVVDPTPTHTPTITPTPTATPTTDPNNALALGQEIVLGNGTSPDIVTDDRGNLHIVYREDSGSIRYLRYTSQGAEAPITIAGNGAGPRLAIDNQNNPHVVYITGSDEVMYTRMVNGSFIPPIEVYDFPDRTEKARIAINQSDNTAFVMYEHVGIKEGSDPETAWVFYYHVIDNSGPTPVIGPRIHPPTDRSSGYVEQSADIGYDRSGTAHYIWRDWGAGGGSRGLHYQSLTASGQYGPDTVLYGGISDFADLDIDPGQKLHIVSTTAWASDGILYMTNASGSWQSYTDFVEYYPVDPSSGENLFDPDHNVPALAYDPNRNLSYIAFSAGETEINHSYANIDSYIATVDAAGNFSDAVMLHDEDRASGGKYNGVRLAPAANRGVFVVVPRLRDGLSSNWEIVLRAVGGAQVGQR